MAGIFKAYDIRGIMGKDLDYEIAYKIGNATAQLLNTREIAVGHDMRPGGEELYRGIRDGITDYGSDVVYVGLIETPMINFATAFYNLGGGIQITASHNPAGYNGFKICREKAIPMSYESGINQIEKLVSDNKMVKGKAKGMYRELYILDDYKKHVLDICGKEYKPLRVVVDAGNGMAGYILPKIVENLALKIVPMYFDLDGTFPNHEANPLKLENVEKLRDRVVKERADVGVAFDGDGDRVAFIDENGAVITCDVMTVIMAETYLSKKSETILYDLRSSWAVKENIEKLGGTPVMCRVGHSYIKKQLRETNGAMAGELSGHYYFRENFFTDSGVIAFLKVMKALGDTGKKISELVAPVKKYFGSGEINSEVKDVRKKLKEIEEIYGKNGKIIHLDGLSIEFDDWWFNIRPSNTEPVLRLNLEAKTQSLMEQKRDELLKAIRS